MKNDIAYSAAANMAWLVNVRQIAFAIPVFEKSNRPEDTSSKPNLVFKAERNHYTARRTALMSATRLDLFETKVIFDE